MKLNLKTITILSLFSILLYGCSNDMKKMNEVYDEFKEEINQDGYNLIGVVNGSSVEIDYTNEANYTLIVENDQGSYSYICSEESSSAWINGEDHSQYLDLEAICSSGEVATIVSEVFKGIDDSGFFNEDYNMEYTIKDNIYKAIGEYSNGEEYILKIDSKNNSLNFKNNTSEIELKAKK